MYEQESPRLSPHLVICIIVCLSWAVNLRDNANLQSQRGKNAARELKLANAAITDMQMRQRDVAALDAKYTKELADAKAERLMLCVMMLPLVVVDCHIKAVYQSVREAHRLRRGYYSLPDWRAFAERIISPSEEKASHY